MAGLLVCMCAALALAQEYDIDNEIARAKKDLNRVASERAKVKADAAKDREDFENYKERTGLRLKALADETDSVNARKAVYALQSDSLGTLLAGVQARTREYGLMQERLRTDLVALCEREMSLAQSLPPALSKQSGAALAFLKSELVAKAVDNIEAMNRLVTLLRDMETKLMDIEIMQGSSPVPDVPGTVYRLRIGGVFEAVVDAKGRRCALWVGPGGDDWRLIDDPAVAQRILKAVNVREGKTVPAIVDLPFPGAQGGGSNE